MNDCQCGMWSDSATWDGVRWRCKNCGGIQTKAREGGSTAVPGIVEPFLVLVCEATRKISLHAVGGRIRNMDSVAGAVRRGKLSAEERRATGTGAWHGTRPA